MAHWPAKVVFADGHTLYGEFNGVVDVMHPQLYDTQAERDAKWRADLPDPDLTDADDDEDATVVVDGLSYHWTCRASRRRKLIINRLSLPDDLPPEELFPSEPPPTAKSRRRKASGRRKVQTATAANANQPGFAFKSSANAELIIDNFAGGGGASLGIEMALGRSPDYAINHNRHAIRLHEANHPHTIHLCEDVWDVNPRHLVAGRRVALVWLSPDCKHFSKAKGGTPVSKKIRGLAWIALRWASLPAPSKPRVIMLENVEEFQDWGPVIPTGEICKKTGQPLYKPCPRRKRQTFRSFVNALRRHGYEVEWRELRGYEQGAPTIRKRLFLVARSDGLPIIWPAPTHGDPDSDAVRAGALQPWPVAADIIDWSLPCPSIFLTKEQVKRLGLKVQRPLAEATMARIFNGVRRYVIEAVDPFIVSVAHGNSGGRRSYGIGEPLGTATASRQHAMVTPYFAPRYQEKPGDQPRTRPVDSPAATIVAGGNAPGSLVTPYLVPRYGERPGQEPRTRSVEDPLATVVTTGNGSSLVSAHLTTANHGAKRDGEHRGQDARDPMKTVTAARDAHGVVAMAMEQAEAAWQCQGCGEVFQDPYASSEPGGIAPPECPRCGEAKNLTAGFLTKFRKGATGLGADEPMHTVTANSYVKRPGGAAPFGVVQAEFVPAIMCNNENNIGRSVDSPLPTITTGNRNYLTAAYLAQQNTGLTGHDAREPVSTIVGKGCTQTPVAVHLSRFHGRSVGGPVDETMRTVETRDTNALVASHMTQFFGSNDGTRGGDMRQPFGSVTAQGQHVGEVRAFLQKYYGTGGQDADCRDPMHTATTRARLGLVTVAGIDYQITDIGMRMLTPRELFRAQGFPDSYIIDRGSDGKPLTQEQQIAACGNSVCPPVAAALVRANLIDAAMSVPTVAAE
jgi:DNA (cytosine-5)-methyltransferase 1